MVIGQASVEGEENPMDADLLALLDLVEAQHEALRATKGYLMTGDWAGSVDDFNRHLDGVEKALRLHAEFDDD
jgi:hypothetical protein